jgi:hypothetical protein
MWDISMTPEEFVTRNPRWREQATDMVATVILQMIREPAYPLPWTDDVVEEIGTLASTMTVEVFSKFRPQMGDAAFGELVLLVGEAAARYANLARLGAEMAAGKSETLQ